MATETYTCYGGGERILVQADSERKAAWKAAHLLHGRYGHPDDVRVSRASLEPAGTWDAYPPGPARPYGGLKVVKGDDGRAWPDETIRITW